MKNVLILVDIQKEYNTPGRPFYLNGIEESLANCKKILLHARKHNWEVVHIMHSNKNKPATDRFMPGTEYFNFIDEFEPSSAEHCFIKTDFSCYSSEKFAAYMDELHINDSDSKIYMIGYNSTMCCLSTLEEARRLGHKYNYIFDASYAKAFDGLSEIETHNFMMKLYKTKNLSTLIETHSLIK